MLSIPRRMSNMQDHDLVPPVLKREFCIHGGVCRKAIALLLRPESLTPHAPRGSARPDLPVKVLRRLFRCTIAAHAAVSVSATTERRVPSLARPQVAPIPSISFHRQLMLGSNVF